MQYSLLVLASKWLIISLFLATYPFAVMCHSPSFGEQKACNLVCVGRINFYPFFPPHTKRKKAVWLARVLRLTSGNYLCILVEDGNTRVYYNICVTVIIMFSQIHVHLLTVPLSDWHWACDISLLTRGVETRGQGGAGPPTFKKTGILKIWHLSN